MLDLSVHRRRLGFAPWREDEGEGAVVADLLGHLERLGKVRLGLAGEADDDVGRDRAVGDVLADQGDPVHVAPPVVGAAHPLQDLAGAGLQRQVDLLAEGRQLGVGTDHVLLHVLRVRAGVTDPLDSLDRVDPGQELGEADPAVLRQLTAVAVDVLSQQRHLADAVGRQRLHLLDQLVGVAADLAPTGAGDDAVGADAVAALGDLQPALELALAAGRQVAGEVLELEVALGAERVGVEELGQLVDLAGTEGDVDEGEALKDLVLDRLGPASADTNHPGRVFCLQPLRLSQVGDEATIGRLADRARIEEDHIRPGPLLGLLVPQRSQHPPHPLRIMHVHLATERSHMKSLSHRGQISAGKGSRVGLAKPLKLLRRRVPPGTPIRRCYLTTSVPSMPASRCPGTEQKKV